MLYLQYCFIDSLALVKMYFNFVEQLHVPASQHEVQQAQDKEAGILRTNPPASFSL